MGKVEWASLKKQKEIQVQINLFKTNHVKTLQKILMIMKIS